MAKVQEALTAINALTSFDFKAVGVNVAELPDVKAARVQLESDGVSVKGVSDIAAQLVYQTTRALGRADSAARSAAMFLGILSETEQWKAATAPDGKAYTNENAFLRDLFPKYAVSTTSVYADVGRNVYIPIKQKRPGYEGLTALASMSPSVVKGILKAIKDDDARGYLPQAIKDVQGDGKLTSRVLVEAGKKASKQASDAFKSAILPDGTENPVETAADLEGKSVEQAVNSTVEARVRMAFMAARNDAGEIASIITEQNALDFVALLTEGAGNANVAMAACKELAKIVNNAIKAQ